MPFIDTEFVYCICIDSKIHYFNNKSCLSRQRFMFTDFNKGLTQLFFAIKENEYLIKPEKSQKNDKENLAKNYNIQRKIKVSQYY